MTYRYASLKRRTYRGRLSDTKLREVSLFAQSDLYATLLASRYPLLERLIQG